MTIAIKPWTGLNINSNGMFYTLDNSPHIETTKHEAIKSTPLNQLIKQPVHSIHSHVLKSRELLQTVTSPHPASRKIRH
jgi:hypothetical protein